MERVILRHLKGSKASQLEEFPMQQFVELTIGRDPNSTIRFDPEKDDLVGRQHARITKDPADPYRFKLQDMNSRNGTFLNKLRVVGEMPLQPGDVIQLGAGGPELQFDLDPLPAIYVKATRLGVAGPVGATVQGVSETRSSATAGSAGSASAPASAAPAPNAIGKATVERMITETKTKSNRTMMVGAAAALVIIAASVAWAKKSADERAAAAQRAAAEASTKANQAGASAASMVSDLASKTSRAASLAAALTPAEINERYGSAVVQIEMAWHLAHTSSGGQVFHAFVNNSYKGRDGKTYPLLDNGRAAIPAYYAVGNDIEPYLTLDQQSGRPIGVEGGGSGFVTKSDGFIVTNRHVAANWRVPFMFDYQADVGILVNGRREPLFNQDGTPAIVRPPSNWIPSETKQDGPKGTRGKYEGRLDYLNVSFPKNTLRLEAQIARVSDRQDVALIKINSPQSLPTVTLYDSYNETKVGEQAVVMGYPAVSPSILQVVKPKDMSNKEAQLREVPDPTLTVGTVAKILRAADGAISDSYGQFNPFGDSYQLNINTTGAGNSGGPMFDNQGRVIGIYSWGRQLDVTVSYAVPIKYALELMTVAPNAR